MRVTYCENEPPTYFKGKFDDGRAFYAVYRHGALNVGIGADEDEAVASCCDRPVLTRIGGGMSMEEFLKALRESWILGE